MVWSENQPSAEEECKIEHTSADDEPYDAGQGHPERDEQHVVLVKVAEEPQDTTPLPKHREGNDDTCGVDHGGGVYLLRACVHKFLKAEVGMEQRSHEISMQTE